MLHIEACVYYRISFTLQLLYFYWNYLLELFCNSYFQSCPSQQFRFVSNIFSVIFLEVKIIDIFKGRF